MHLFFLLFQWSRQGIFVQRVSIWYRYLQPWIYNRTLDKNQIKRWRASHIVFLLFQRDNACASIVREGLLSWRLEDTWFWKMSYELFFKFAISSRFDLLSDWNSKLNIARTSWIYFSNLILKIRFITREINNSSYKVAKILNGHIFQTNSCKNLYLAYVKLGNLRIIVV